MVEPAARALQSVNWSWFWNLHKPLQPWQGSGTNIVRIGLDGQFTHFFRPHSLRHSPDFALQ